jgi:ADP-ribose pyrophosphatase YjhB (NUDIX family)
MNTMSPGSPYKTPLVTVDIIIEVNGSIVLIKRANPPHGWALPGGFLDYGESLESCAVREAKEETSLDIQLIEQFHTYSAADRDPRHHTITTVFIASASSTPKANDDAKEAKLYDKENLPYPIVFDHGQILAHYFSYKNGALKQDIFQ